MKENIKDIIKIIGFAIASIVFSILMVNSIKSLSYKEVEAILISHGEIIRHTESSDSCIGTFEYFVSDKRYETSFSIDYQYCFKGYKMTIYYDANDPTISSKDKSIFMLGLFAVFDIVFIAGLIYSIKDFFKQSKNVKEFENEPHKIDNSKDNDNRFIELDSDIYGKYKLEYNSLAVDNQNNSDDRRCLAISGHSLDLFEVFIPKDILNSVFETNKMNDVLKKYNQIESNNYNRIMEKLINQEIKTLSTWCEVPNSSEGKKMLIDNGTINSTSIELDKSFNIVKIYFTYYYKEVGSGSLTFSYDVKTEEVESLGASS